MDKLSEIRARLAAATPGPWWYSDKHLEVFGGHGNPNSLAMLYCAANAYDANGEFIAHAPADIETLLAEVERLREHLAEARRIISDTRWSGIRVSAWKHTADELLA